jgi:hypothetical protein
MRCFGMITQFNHLQLLNTKNTFTNTKNTVLEFRKLQKNPLGLTISHR